MIVRQSSVFLLQQVKQQISLFQKGMHGQSQWFLQTMIARNHKVQALLSVYQKEIVWWQLWASGDTSTHEVGNPNSTNASNNPLRKQLSWPHRGILGGWCWHKQFKNTEKWGLMFGRSLHTLRMLLRNLSQPWCGFALSIQLQCLSISIRLFGCCLPKHQKAIVQDSIKFISPELRQMLTPPLTLVHSDCNLLQS